MQGNTAKCNICGREFTNQEDATLHKVKAHGDVDAVNYLSTEDKEVIHRKVIVRNLHLSGIPAEIIALQVDLDLPEVLRIIEEIKKEWVA